MYSLGIFITFSDWNIGMVWSYLPTPVICRTAHFWSFIEGSRTDRWESVSPYGKILCIIRINKCIVLGQQCWVIELFFFCFISNTNIWRYLTLDVIYMRFIRKVTVHHYSQNLSMLRHTNFSIVYNEVIFDVNISPPFPEYNEMGLFKFEDNLLMFNQSIMFIISLFICSISLSGHFPERNIFELSANRRRNKTFETLDRSLIYNRHNNGPRMDPWVTPPVTFLRLELVHVSL